jgi:hypothetical protein
VAGFDLTTLNSAVVDYTTRPQGEVIFLNLSSRGEGNP